MDRVTYVFENKELCAATWRNLVIWFAIGHGTETTMKACGEQLAKLAETNPQGVVFVLVVRLGAPMPSSGARAEAVAFIKSLSESFQAWATVVDGTGFFAGMARSVMVGVLALARRSFPSKAFGTIDQAADWLADVATSPEGVAHTRDDLMAALEEVRDRGEALLAE